MAFDFASAKHETRRVVHETLGVSASYQNNSVAPIVPIRARWHTRNQVVGDLDNNGYAQVEDGPEKIVLERAQAATLGVSRGGVITLPALYGSIRLILQQPQESTGPYEVVWEVVRE